MPGSAVDGYCYRCGRRSKVYRTVPWQDDVCVRCGSPDVEIDSWAEEE